MKSDSLKNRILKYLLNQGGWVNGGEVERLAMSVGYKASNASRRLRELHEDGLITREERKGERAKSVWYCAVQPLRWNTWTVDGKIIRKEPVYS